MRAPWRRKGQPSARYAARIIVASFATAAVLGSLVLMLPVASEGDRSTSFLDALFTSTSAVCVTGLIVVDTPVHWSPVGEGVILALIQVGGFGLMTLSSLIVVLLSRRLGLRQRVVAATASGTLDVSDVRRLLIGVARFTASVEAVAATALFLRFWVAHDEPIGRAAYLGLFHSVSAFNNAGFSLFSDNLVGYADDPVILLVIAGSIITGGLGFPVWVEIVRAPRRPSRWSLHAKITVFATGVLLTVGTALLAWFEWTNTATMGGLSTSHSAVNAFFHSVQPRTAGFNSLDMTQLREPSLLLTEILMFIGAGSASTGGGIKVSTFALLGWVMWAEARGEPDVVVFHRRVPDAAQRQALTVALLALGVLVASTMLLMALSSLPREDLFFEAVSALGTVGLSTGVTPSLPPSSQVVIMGLMLLGRVGPVTLFAGLVLRERSRRYRHPSERPLIG